MEREDINRHQVLNIIKNVLKSAEFEELEGTKLDIPIEIFISDRPVLDDRGSLGLNSDEVIGLAGKKVVTITMPSLVVDSRDEEKTEKSRTNYFFGLANELREASIEKNQLWKSREFQEFSYIVDMARTSLFRKYSQETADNKKHLVNQSQESQEYLEGFKKYLSLNFGEEFNMMMNRFKTTVILDGYKSSPPLSPELNPNFIKLTNKIVSLNTGSSNEWKLEKGINTDSDESFVNRYYLVKKYSKP